MLFRKCLIIDVNSAKFKAVLLICFKNTLHGNMMVSVGCIVFIFSSEDCIPKRFVDEGNGFVLVIDIILHDRGNKWTVLTH